MDEALAEKLVDDLLSVYEALGAQQRCTIEERVQYQQRLDHARAAVVAAMVD